MTGVRFNLPQLRSGRCIAAVCCAVIGLLMAGCAGPAKFWDTHRPILGDPTRDSGGGASAPNAGAPYPKLAIVPARPKATDNPAERKKIASELVADQQKAEYTAATLRGGDVPPAAPPPSPVVKSVAEPQAKSAVSVPPASPRAGKNPVSSLAVAAQSTEPAAPAGPEIKVAEETASQKPGIWKRFFGHRESPPPDPNKPAPLPAQPVTPVIIQPSAPASPKT